MEEDQNQRSKEQLSRVLKVLEALKQASHELQTHPPKANYSSESNSPAIKALLELETESDAILSTDPNLSSLCYHLSELKSLVNSLHSSHNRLSLRDFLSRRVSSHSLSKVAGEIESEIQAWIDRESVENLSKALTGSLENEEPVLGMLVRFEQRVDQGFDRELQDLVLKAKIFTSLEKILCDPNCSKRLREQCASVIAGLIRFNKDVFVGQVLMGPLVHALVSTGSCKSLKVLCSLIRSIKSPFVDEIESNGEIPKIISFLDNKDLDMRVLAMDCIFEIGYFGRKEAIEAMFKEGLIKKLVELQRSELGGDLIDMGMFKIEEEKNGSEVKKGSRGKKERKFLERHPFASCVARFGVQLEVGEGLRQREKRAFKQEILKKVREACVSDADAATIVAEVLWGSSP